MTKEQFFEMELPLNMTRNEMSDLMDALFVTESYYKAKGMKALAKNCDKLYTKIRDIAKKYDNYLDEEIK